MNDRFIFNGKEVILMHSGFTRGLIVGGILGASIMMMNPEMMKNRTKKKMMRTGRDFMRRSGNIIGDVVGMLR